VEVAFVVDAFVAKKLVVVALVVVEYTITAFVATKFVDVALVDEAFVAVKAETVMSPAVKCVMFANVDVRVSMTPVMKWPAAEKRFVDVAFVVDA